MKKEYKCSSCGVPVFRYDCQLKVTKQICCSKKCVDDLKRNGSVTNCAFCDTPFYRRFGEQDLEKGRVNQFCSKECYSNHRILNAKKTTYLKFGSVHRHIIVAEIALGRSLNPGEIVHHIDEDKHNNNIENLAVLPDQKYHADVHFGKKGFEQYKLINLIKND